MRARAELFVLLSFLTALSASGQLRPLFDPDDFIDPRHLDGPVFISRVVLGAMRSGMDDYRPLHQDAGFLHFTNSVHWSHYEFHYKHTEMRGENANGPIREQTCLCVPPVFFPVSPDPLPGRRDSLQFGWYRHQAAADPADPEVMLRTRISLSRKDVDTEVTFLDTNHHAFSRDGHEQSIGIERDVDLLIAGRDFFGTILVSRMRRSGTTADDSHNEFTYVSRFPVKAFGRVLVRGTFTVGGVTGQGANGVNVLNPAFEAFFHEWSTQANLHLIWSPIRTRTNGQGWVTHHQILISIDRGVLIKLLASH